MSEVSTLPVLRILAQLPQERFDWVDPLTNIVAVMIGAALAYFTTHAFERRRERLERHGRVLGLFLKVRDLVDGPLKIRRQLRESIQQAVDQGLQGEVFQKIHHIIYIEDYKVVLRTEELVVLTEHHHYDLIQSISELRDGYNSMIGALAFLFKRREEFAAKGTVMMNGAVGTVSVSHDPNSDPNFFELKMLGNDILEGLDKEAARAADVAKRFNEVLPLYTTDRRFPRIALPED